MLFITMVRLVQCTLPAASSFSNTCFLWHGALKSVGFFPERGGNCLWHTGRPSVLRFDCKQLTVPSTLGWRDSTSSGEDIISPHAGGAQVPCFRSCPCCIQPWSQCPARADWCGGCREQPGQNQPFRMIPHGSSCCRRGLRFSSRQWRSEGQCVGTCLCSFLPLFFRLMATVEK